MMDNLDFLSSGVTAVAVFIALILVGLLVMLTRFYRKVDQGSALIVNTLSGEPTVTFTGGLVLPIIHRAETMDISVKTIDIDRRSKDGLICADNIRADIKVMFFVRVNKTADDVLKVAQAIGCDRASDQKTMEQLFVAKFSEALKTVGKRMEFEELYTKRDVFRDEIIQVIGKDLNGYVLDDAAIDYLEQTALDNLDPSNILDAQGIRKITRITSEQNVATNLLRQDERKAIKKQDVDAQEKILELDRQQADAEAKQAREIAVLRAREAAETDKVQSEEKQRSELARIKQEEQVQVEDQNRHRQVEIAQKARERAVLVETERVEKERQLEAISREREVEVQRIEKEKALEVERKVIADAVASRISVEKTVAEEEERIKDLRLIADAKRNQEATVIRAEAAASEAVAGDLKKAEAREVMAKHAATEQVTLAEGDLEASERQARAKIRLAEGVQAETAATGLAEVRVKEAMALAIEKQGRADASASKEMRLAEAAGIEATGLAEVHVKQEEADAISRIGSAEASATQLKLTAEAAGLREKAEAMQQLDGVGREHEEFRLSLDKQKEVEMESIRSRVDIAEHNSAVVAEAMKSARINLVGGDGKFLDQFFSAVSVGQSLDGVVENSDTVKQAVGEYIDGDASFRSDLKEVLTRPALDADSLKDLSVTALLMKMMDSSNTDAGKNKFKKLLDSARDIGLE